MLAVNIYASTYIILVYATYMPLRIYIMLKNKIKTKNQPKNTKPAARIHYPIRVCT